MKILDLIYYLLDLIVKFIPFLKDLVDLAKKLRDFLKSPRTGGKYVKLKEESTRRFVIKKAGEYDNDDIKYPGRYVKRKHQDD